MPSIQSLAGRGANWLLSPFGVELRRKAVPPPADTAGSESGDATADGLFRQPDPKDPGYYAVWVEEARALGMDVNDYLEQRVGWEGVPDILAATVVPYLHPDARVCNLGVGTGRWARHVLAHLPEGQLYLVDHSPWFVNFLVDYFRDKPNVHVYLNDGYSLPFEDGAVLDLIFSFGTFIALNDGYYLLYGREFARTLRPGGHAVVEYLDPLKAGGWHLLEESSASEDKALATCMVGHVPEMVTRAFTAAGLNVVKHEPLWEDYHGSFVIAQKPV